MHASAAAFSIDIIDPLNRTGKINVPSQLVLETRGLQEYLESAVSMQPKDFSLCLLFQRGSCRGGSRCHQIHVNPSFVESLREKARAARTCCAVHGDVHSGGFVDCSTVITLLRDGEEERYALSAFGRTAALDNQLRVHHRTGADIRLPATRLCRLHLSSRCKFGKDCKNIHLCPEAEILMMPSSKTRSPSVDGGDCCGVSTGSAGSITPREHSVEEIAVTPLMQWKHVSPIVDYSPNPLGDSSAFGFGVSETSTFESSSMLDMSAFEATMQALCEDLERAEFSPNTAVRVRSNCNLLSLRE